MCCESTRIAVAGMPRADLGRGAQPLVVIAGRHPDVDDGQVGLVLGDDGEQRLGVADAAHDVVAGVLEQAREPLAQQRRVLRDHDAHGNSASIGTRAREAVDRQRAALGLDPVPQPDEPGPAVGARASDTVVGDEQPRRSAWRRPGRGRASARRA